MAAKIRSRRVIASIESATRVAGINASYVSTGAGGADYEVDVAAACLARLLTETGDRLLPEGYVSSTVGLQDRSGPTGFDDAAVVASNAAGDEISVFVQAKRQFSFAPSGDFPALIRAVAAHDLAQPDPWLAALVAGETSLPVEGIQALLESARRSPDATAFEARWAKEGATNRSKRDFLSAVRTALNDDRDAAWRAMRRLVVLDYDYHLVHSRDRDTILAAIDSQFAGVGQDATALFGRLRDIVLRSGKIAAQWNRLSLVADLDVLIAPSRNLSTVFASLESSSSAALDAIPTHIQGIAPTPAISLLRGELYDEAKAILETDGCVRLSGEGGSGKSGMLRRLASGFDGRVLALKDDRVVAHSWASHVAALGITIDAQQVADEFAASGPCLLAIDGADRLLLSHRRGVLLDLFRAIAASPLRDRWAIVTSARDFQTRDLVATALNEAGLPLGRRCAIGSLDGADIALLGEVFPAIKSLVRRGDLSDRNRILFLLREVLASPSLPTPYTEIGLAAAWATRGASTDTPHPERDHALAALGELLLCRPERRPGRGDVDPAGLGHLLAEDVVYAHPMRDTIAFTHDVHEDWVLARAFERHRTDLPRLIAAADQPLWWLRAMRLLGQMLLEDGDDPGAWLQLLDSISADPALDPAWARSLLVAPLYSEQSHNILDGLENALLANDGALLVRLLDTLLVYETRLEDQLLKSPALAEMSEVERLRTVAAYRIPQWRSWMAFLGWSLRKWRQWPANLVPRLSEVGSAWVFATEGSASPFAKGIVTIAAEWLAEVEDARHTDTWDDHRDPFGLAGLAYDSWKEIEARLQRTLKMGVTAAPEIVDAYLARLGTHARLDTARGDLINMPRRVPALLPRSYVDVAIKHFTPRRRRERRDDWLIQPECFSSFSYQDAGIAHDHGFFPSSPLRGGFADLFASDEQEALRLFHRLEMRAAVFYRHYVKWHDRRRVRAVRLATPWGTIPLWGDENVYRWARGSLGPHVLGSAYLALEEWLASEAAAGRPLSELFQLVLQPNGLVATASPCINLLVDHINTQGQIDAAAPFLGAPRLWHYDLRRFLDDRTNVGAIGFMSRDDFFEAAQRVQARYSKRQFLPNDLLLPFQLMAGEEARALFREQRESWAPSDLAAFDDELENPAAMAEFEDQMARHRSDSDPERITVEKNPNGEGLIVQIEPPEEALPRIEQLNRDQHLLNEVSRLSLWVSKSREANALQPSLSLADAVALADTLEAVEVVDEQSTAALFWRLRASGIVGAAALIARYGTDDELDEWQDWARARILGGCRIMRSPEDEGLLIDQAKLFDDPQLYGAEGLSALINRARDLPGDRELALELATHRLQDVAAAMVQGLDWQAVPDFAWSAMVAAFDICVLRRNRFWMKGDDKRALARRRRDREAAIKTARNGFAKAPASPPPPYVDRWYWQRKWRWPLKRVRVQSKWVFDWSRAPVLLKKLDYQAIARNPEHRGHFERYLAQIIDWARAFSQDKVADRYQNHYPYELMHALAEAAGRLAAAGGSSNLWEPFKAFGRRDAGDDLIGDYMDAVATELVESGRAPDERFWSAWQPPADAIIGAIRRPRRYRPDFDQLSRGAAAAGFVGPYMSPIPPDWPHLDAILPSIDRWASVSAYSFSAAHSLLQFAERFDVRQRTEWLVRWLSLYVDEHQGDQQFWGYGSIGDRAAALLKPLERADPAVRRKIRRLLGVIADAGSLGARDVLSLFASGRA